MERIIKDKKELVKLVSFLTMCDGGLYIKTKRSDGNTENCNPKFIMNHTSEQYVEYARAILANVTGVTVEDRKDYNVDEFKRSPQKRLYTQNHPFFRNIWERTYKEGYKGLDTHALKMMDAECLGMLYMAEGGIALTKTGGINSVCLHTKRLTEGDNRFLALMIERRFGIESTLNRHYGYTYLRIKGKSLYRFFEVIKPHILSDFDYKIPNDELLSKYKQDDEIVCTTSEDVEVSRND
jgi:hypothetical protein